MKKFIVDFKKFLLRGNIIDLAVAVVIGAAFSQIINSFVTYIINPFIAVLTTKTDLTHLSTKVGSVTIEYGKFIAALINFVIIAFVIFIIVEIISKAKSKVNNQEHNEVVVALETTDDILKDIRKLLEESKNITNS